MSVMSLPFAEWRSRRQPPIKLYPRFPPQWRELSAFVQDELEPFREEEQELIDPVYLALADRVWPG